MIFAQLFFGGNSPKLSGAQEPLFVCLFCAWRFHLFQIYSWDTREFWHLKKKKTSMGFCSFLKHGRDGAPLRGRSFAAPAPQVRRGYHMTPQWENLKALKSHCQSEPEFLPTGGQKQMWGWGWGIHFCLHWANRFFSSWSPQSTWEVHVSPELWIVHQHTSLEKWTPFCKCSALQLVGIKARLAWVHPSVYPTLCKYRRTGGGGGEEGGHWTPPKHAESE